MISLVCDVAGVNHRGESRQPRQRHRTFCK
jgi:hypothetical protein